MNTATPTETLTDRLRRFYEERDVTVTDQQIRQDIEGIAFEKMLAITNGSDPLDAQEEWFARRAGNLIYVEKLYGS